MFMGDVGACRVWAADYAITGTRAVEDGAFIAIFVVGGAGAAVLAWSDGGATMVNATP